MGLSLTSFTFRHLVCFSFLIFHHAIAHFVSSTQPLCHHHERSALLNFKESLVINQTASSYSSTYPKVATWKPDEKNRDCCSWDGNLTQLDSLTNSNSNFSGLMSSLLSWLTNLNQLTSLNFPYCNLNNEIPFGISNLTQLTALDLSYNQLNGPIPYSLMKLKKVSSLFLGFNQLSGRIQLKLVT
ncbi:hypothetical protein AB3S75_006375 [Citrus x aurantiifolia]